MKKLISLLLILGSCSLAVANKHKHLNANAIMPTVYAALPVLETSVPDSVVSQLKEKYGAGLYDITMVMASTDEVEYVIRTENNGVYTTLSLTGSEVK